MPRGGHNAKPTQLKVVEGTARSDRVNDAEPKPETLTAAELKPPAGLDRFGKQAWRELAPELAKLDLLTAVDRYTLAIYCDAYSQWRRASRALRKLDPVDEDYRRVAVSVEKARNEMRLAGVEFGLSPASRGRLRVGNKQEAHDPFEEFLNSGSRSTG